MEFIRNYCADFPHLIKKFCIRALLLIIIWKLCYHLYLKPHRTIDAPLTKITVATTVAGLSIFYPTHKISWIDVHNINDTQQSSAIIYFDGKKSLGVADACNALELLILYVGFIICMPTTFKRMAVFSVLGLIGIFLLNISRCSAMFWFNLNSKQWFHFAHHYLFKIIVYAVIFGAWVWYCKKLEYNEQS